MQRSRTGRSDKQAAAFDGQQLFINAGARSDQSAGDQLMMQRVANKVTDSETGQVLSVMKNGIGVLHLTGVEGQARLRHLYVDRGGPAATRRLGVHDSSMTGGPRTWRGGGTLVPKDTNQGGSHG